MLLDDAWYPAAVGYAKGSAAATARPSFITEADHATLLTERRRRQPRGLGIQIGFSLDGPPISRRRYRMRSR